MGEHLVLDFCGADKIVNARIYGVFYALFFFGFLAVIPTVESTNEIAGNAAETFKRNVAFFTSAAWTDRTGDDTGESADGVTVDRVVYGAVADAAIMHFANDCFESFDVLGRVTVEFDIGNVASVTKFVIWSFDFDFSEGGNWIVDRDVERVGVEVAVCYAFDDAVLFSVDLCKASSEAFGRSSKKRVV